MRTGGGEYREGLSCRRTLRLLGKLLESRSESMVLVSLLESGGRKAGDARGGRG